MRIAFITKPFVVELLGIAYLAAVLKKEGHQVELFRTDYLIPFRLNRFKPEVLAYSITTGQHSYYQKLNKSIKGEGVLSIFGGAHPTYFPEFLNEEGVDCIVRGEGEGSIFLALQEGRPGTKVRIEPFGLIQDLDSIPFPDRRFLYKYPENKYNPMKNVMTSRGCPFSCPYCFNSVYRSLYKGQKWVRYRSPSNVIQECLELKQYYLKMIFFQDDEFLLNPKLEEFLLKYKQVGVPFHCQLRIEFLTEDKVKLLKEAGCYSVTFAIESGNRYIRWEILKRQVEKEVIKKGAELLHKYGIKFRTENMVGIPGESIEQMMDTVKLNQEVNPTLAWCSLFQPYPNLPLSNYALKEGYWDGRTDYKESFFEESMLNLKNKDEVENLQRLFSTAVRLNLPEYLIRILIGFKKNKCYDVISKETKKKLYSKLYGEEKKK